MKQRQKTGALNLFQIFREWMKGESVPHQLLNEMKRMERRAARQARYMKRNASYPYASTRQNTRELRKRLRREAALKEAA